MRLPPCRPPPGLEDHNVFLSPAANANNFEIAPGPLRSATDTAAIGAQRRALGAVTSAFGKLVLAGDVVQRWVAAIFIMARLLTSVIVTRCGAFALSALGNLVGASYVLIECGVTASTFCMFAIRLFNDACCLRAWAVWRYNVHFLSRAGMASINCFWSLADACGSLGNYWREFLYGFRFCCALARALLELYALLIVWSLFMLFGNKVRWTQWWCNRGGRAEISILSSWREAFGDATLLKEIGDYEICRDDSEIPDWLLNCGFGTDTGLDVKYQAFIVIMGGEHQPLEWE